MLREASNNMEPVSSISVFIITRNEADRIGQTVRSVRRLTDDIVVVDSGSTDNTVAIAEELGARVTHNEWPGYGPQKRFAETLCKNEWLLNIDADEVVTPELAGEIKALFRNGPPDNDAYTLPISEVYPGEKKAARFAYTLNPVRLYNRTMGRYADSTVHDRVVLEKNARTGHLANRIHHYTVRSLGDQMQKLLSYTEMQANSAQDRGRNVPAPRLFLEFPLAFIKAYFLRRHFLRGRYGYAIAMNYAFFRHIRLVKMLELSIERQRGDMPKVDGPRSHSTHDSISSKPARKP